MDKPKEIVEFEKKNKIVLSKTDNIEDLTRYGVRNCYFLDYRMKVIGLNIQHNEFEKIPDLLMFTSLRILSLCSNRLTETNGLKGLKKLEELYLAYNQIVEIQGFEDFEKLKILNLNRNSIKKITGFDNLRELNELYLRSNFISNLEGIEKLGNLTTLYLSDNLIYKVKGIEKLNKLFLLNLNSNEIDNIIDLSDILNITSLKYLDVSKNKFSHSINLVLEKQKNHLDTIKNELRKLKDVKENFKLPIKISLLGNHASGKSTFLEYFKSGTIVGGNSTHILNVEIIENVNFPEAVFFDFGGQDYYHGIYKAFLTDASVNMLFWHPDTDENEIQVEDDSNGYNNIHFNRSYWLGQIDYIEEIVFPKNENKETINKNIYQIQTHSDSPNSLQSILQNHRTKRFYYISLDSKAVETNKYKHDVEALKEEIKELIENRKEEKKSVNEIKLYEYILETKKTDNKVEVKNLLKPYNKKEDEINLLKAELDQLSKKGFVLYYKNCPALENVVWLNVNDTVKEIHEKLDSAYLNEKKGEISQKEFEDKIEDNDIIELLKYNKVIFLDNNRRIKGNITPTYIIPSYLPYSINEEEEYFIFKNQKYDVSLKFTDFIPFGFMNLLICKYGGEGEVKTYRKDNLVFTLNEKKVKVMINLDFEKLIIGVNIHCYDNINKKEIEQKILMDILKIYNNEEDYELIADSINSKTQYTQIPNDMYLSIDGVNFVHFKTLEDKEATQNQILAYPLDEQSQIVKEKARTISTYPFKNISFNPNLKQMKKIFISYSHENTKERDRLLIFLKPLENEGKIIIWHDLKLKAGENVENEIINKLNESDIIILLVSQSFISSDFIYTKELPLAMKKCIDNGIKIIPVLLSECTIFDLNLDIKDDLSNGDKTRKIQMGNYYFKPQDENNNIKPLLEWGDKNIQDKAWKQIYEEVKQSLRE